jgi:tetratricopeptide (TPR) repeat protein
MDKYEFNIKVEQIRKLANKGDYETAMKIADSIDWKKVRNANLLSLVSEIYEKNGEYQDAKDVLLLAFDRAPVGKRFLYKLTELALKEGSPDEAETYYREFCELSGDDPRQYLLRYMILKEKKAPLEQMIHALERYTAEDLDEKWLYELAELYHQAGDSNHCVSTCDKIMLMFGLGKYVDKAMELKLQYAPLSKYQMDLVENREKYEARLRAVEQSFRGMPDGEDDYTEDSAEETSVEDKVVAASEVDEKLLAEVSQAEMEADLKKEMSRMAPETEEEKQDKSKTRVLSDIRRKAHAEESVTVETDQETEEESRPVKMKNHLMVEARTPEKGLELALETLKKIQRETGVKNPVAKISGSKLNKKGILANADKLAGKDLLIEQAGDLEKATIDELEQFMADENSEIRVILIDNPRQMEQLHAENPSLASHFECIASPDAFKKDDTAAEGNNGIKPSEQEAETQQSEDERPVRRVTPVNDGAMRAPDKKELVEDTSSEEPDADEELDIDDFAQYACSYAADIDCNVSGKSMLALYERIEVMEEDGIPLTRANAEALIEEAADKAEKKTFKSLFSAKYDKQGLLILREEHFIS